MTDHPTTIQLRETGMTANDIQYLFGVDNRVARHMLSGRTTLHEEQQGQVIQLLEDMAALRAFLKANEIEFLPLNSYLKIISEISCNNE